VRMAPTEPLSESARNLRDAIAIVMQQGITPVSGTRLAKLAALKVLVSEFSDETRGMLAELDRSRSAVPPIGDASAQERSCLSVRGHVASPHGQLSGRFVREGLWPRVTSANGPQGQQFRSRLTLGTFKLPPTIGGPRNAALLARVGVRVRASMVGGVQIPIGEGGR
jgi:hypothetical protein